MAGRSTATWSAQLRPVDLEGAYKRALRAERAAWQDYQQHLDGPEDTVRQHLDSWLDSVRQADLARDAFLRSELAPIGESEARDLKAELRRALREQKDALGEFDRRSRKRGTGDPNAFGTWLDTLRATNSVRGHLASERQETGRDGDGEHSPPRTELLGDAKVPDEDPQILQALAVTTQAAPAGATQFRAGIRNGAGVVYRTVTLFGISEKVNFSRRLEALGYEDERFAGRKPPPGYDLMYSQPRRPAAG